jgi:hypothetical protein
MDNKPVVTLSFINIAPDSDRKPSMPEDKR